MPIVILEADVLASRPPCDLRMVPRANDATIDQIAEVYNIVLFQLEPLMIA